MTQTTLPFHRNRHEEKYRAWTCEHPEIVALFLRFAREQMALGRHFGIKALVERTRYEALTFPEKQGEFRLNNSWTAYLSRDLLQLEPRLKDYIETRRVTGEDGR